MSTITFDTLKFAARLEEAGMPRAQAAAMAEAQKDVFAEALDSQLATRSDIVQLDRRLDGIESEIKLLRWMMGAMLGIGITILFKLFH